MPWLPNTPRKRKLLALRKEHEVRERGYTFEVNMGSDYTAPELAFLKRIEEFKQRRRRMCPTWCECFAVLLSLGYTLTGKPGPLPEAQGPRCDRKNSTRRDGMT